MTGQASRIRSSSTTAAAAARQAAPVADHRALRDCTPPSSATTTPGMSRTNMATATLCGPATRAPTTTKSGHASIVARWIAFPAHWTGLEPPPPERDAEWLMPSLKNPPCVPRAAPCGPWRALPRLPFQHGYSHPQSPMTASSRRVHGQAVQFDRDRFRPGGSRPVLGAGHPRQSGLHELPSREALSPGRCAFRRTRTTPRPSSRSAPANVSSTVSKVSPGPPRRRKWATWRPALTAEAWARATSSLRNDFRIRASIGSESDSVPNST